ncbi:MAG: class I SAM-dependent methyltransferase [Gammaproteobacteria bacterium]|tara:strand:- start:12 stop:1007 length:996 start_codon:yes stop_codon:yes gene_type:complete
MKQTSNLRLRLKYLVSLGIPVSYIDRIRNILSLRYIFLFDRKLRKRVLELLKKYDTPISENLELLKSLNKEFQTINNIKNYTFDNLKLSAKHRFNYLKSKGLDFKNKKMADFGSGHGENLFLCKELGFNEAVGLDFSDKDFLPHENDLPKESFQAIEFKTLDLVHDPLEIKDFDLITSCSAFEHFHDPSEVLDKCYNGLKRGGYLYAEFAAFNSPYATHRKIFSGVPHIQNIFNAEVSFEFFYDFLKINDKRNRYTNEPITDGNPYPEVNRLLIEDYERIFLDKTKWEVVEYIKVYNYQYHWFIKCFSEQFKDKNKDYKYVDYLKFLIKKK